MGRRDDAQPGPFVVSAGQRVRDVAKDARTPRTVKDGYTAAVLALRQRGCAAADYRLSGPGQWPRFCVIRLRRGWRLVMEFPQPDEVLLVLLEPHNNDNDPAVGLAERYNLPPIDDLSAWRDERDPPCCTDASAPPGWPALAELVSSVNRDQPSATTVDQ